MRNSDSANGEALAGLSPVVTENSFRIELVKSSLEANLDLLKTRQWIDIPMEFSDDLMAKLTIEIGDAGQRALKEAIASWTANPDAASSPALTAPTPVQIETPVVTCAPVEGSLSSLTDIQRQDFEVIKSLTLKFGNEFTQVPMETPAPGKAVLQWSLKSTDPMERTIFKICMYGSDALLPPEPVSMMTGSSVNFPSDSRRENVTISNSRAENGQTTFCLATVEPHHSRDFAICSTSIDDLVGVGVVTAAHGGPIDLTSHVDEATIKKASDIARHVNLLTHDKLMSLRK